MKEILNRRTGKSHERTSTSCDRERPPLMDIESKFTASKSNTQHNMAAEGIDSNTISQTPRREPSKLPTGIVAMSYFNKSNRGATIKRLTTRMRKGIELKPRDNASPPGGDKLRVTAGTFLQFNSDFQPAFWGQLLLKLDKVCVLLV